MTPSTSWLVCGLEKWKICYAIHTLQNIIVAIQCPIFTLNFNFLSSFFVLIVILKIYFFSKLSEIYIEYEKLLLLLFLYLNYSGLSIVPKTSTYINALIYQIYRYCAVQIFLSFFHGQLELQNRPIKFSLGFLSIYFSPHTSPDLLHWI